MTRANEEAIKIKEKQREKERQEEVRCLLLPSLLFVAYCLYFVIATNPALLCVLLVSDKM